MDFSCNQKMYEENPIAPEEKRDNKKITTSMLVSNQSLKLFISLKSRNKNGEKIRSRATYSDSSLQVSPFLNPQQERGDINKMRTHLGGNAENNAIPMQENKKASSNITIKQQKGISSTTKYVFCISNWKGFFLLTQNYHL